MIIKGMRWGYDGGDMACGPIDGSCLVEVTFLDGNKKLYVTEGLYDMSETIWVTRKPIYNKMMDGEFDPDEEEYLDMVEVSSEDPEIEEEGIEMIQESEYEAEINFVRYAMQAFSTEDDEESAREFIAPYLDMEASDITVEIPHYAESDED